MAESTRSTRAALARARVELPVLRRASGMFEGSHASIFTGHGHDFAELVEYRHGDDVTDIDWRSSARAGRPIIRRFERNSDVYTQLVVDTSVTMRAAAPSGEPKADIARVLADLLGYLATIRGDRLGLLAGDSTGVTRYPARHGNEHLEFTLARIADHVSSASGGSDVTAMLDHLLSLPQPRSLLLVITDEFWPRPSDEQALRKIRTKHDVVVCRIADMPMTQPGIERMADVATGVLIPAFVRDDAELRDEWNDRRVKARMRADALLRALGVPHAVVSSTAEVPRVLGHLLRRRGRVGVL